MGLVTFILLLSLTTLYISRAWQSKPAFVNTSVKKISQNLDKIALYGSAFALISLLLTPVLIYSGANMMIRLFANILIIVMALPAVANQLLPKYQEKINPAVLEEIRNFLAWIMKNEQYIGYAGGLASVLMFLILFA